MFIVRVFTVHVYDSKSSKYCNFKELRILLSVFVNMFVVEFFQILHKYEERGIVFNEYRPYLWGKEARMYYNIHSNQERNLLNQPTTTQVLNSLDQGLVMNTIHNYPFQRSIRINVIFIHFILIRYRLSRY